VFWALQVVALELQGKPRDQIDQLTRHFRSIGTSSETESPTPQRTPKPTRRQ
jgi:hypothetical protein